MLGMTPSVRPPHAFPAFSFLLADGRQRRARSAGRRSPAPRGAQPPQYAGHPPVGLGQDRAAARRRARSRGRRVASGDGGMSSPVPLAGCIENRAGDLAGAAVFVTDRGRRPAGTRTAGARCGSARGRRGFVRAVAPGRAWDTGLTESIAAATGISG